MNIALLGVGKVTEYYLRALSLLPQIQITDAYDPEVARMQALPQSITRHRTAQHLIDSSPADVIVISSPTDTHFQHLKTALSAGRRTAVEKPLVSNAADLAELERLSAHESATIYAMFHFAFGVEILRWKQICRHLKSTLGSLKAVSCRFYDPYIANGDALAAGKSLSGSWLDSGINALTVLDEILADATLVMLSSTMISLRELPCTQIAGNALLSGKTPSEGFIVHIDTSWTLNVNSKTTTLYYEHCDVTLDHSQESITLTWRDGLTEKHPLNAGLPPAVTRYRGLFSDLHSHYSSKATNLDSAIPRHRLLLDASATQCAKVNDRPSR